MSLSKLANDFTEFERMHKNVLENAHLYKPYEDEYTAAMNRRRNVNIEYSTNPIPGMLSGFVGAAGVGALSKKPTTLKTLGTGIGLGVGVHALWNGRNYVQGYDAKRQANARVDEARSRLPAALEAAGIRGSDITNYHNDLHALESSLFEKDIDERTLEQQISRLEALAARGPQLNY